QVAYAKRKGFARDYSVGIGGAEPDVVSTQCRGRSPDLDIAGRVVAQRGSASGAGAHTRRQTRDGPRKGRSASSPDIDLARTRHSDRAVVEVAPNWREVRRGHWRNEHVDRHLLRVADQVVIGRRGLEIPSSSAAIGRARDDSRGGVQGQ